MRLTAEMATADGGAWMDALAVGALLGELIDAS